MSLVTVFGTDPETCEEYGYGLGRPDGILVLRYTSAGALDFAESRQDILHQLYWSPDGPLSVTHGVSTHFVDSTDSVWVHRAVTHAVHALDRQTVYRICLREVPEALAGLRIATASMPPATAELVGSLASPCAEEVALSHRRTLMSSLGASVRDLSAPHSDGPGWALRVARALAQDPSDPTTLDEWATRLHLSVKTLQRDFLREFGQPFTTWRTDLRLRASLVLLDTHPVTEVAHRVGYSTPSAYITAFTRHYGHTPGRHPLRHTG
ncbi:helix-turn-helix transcriptional regulator [Kribbella italica]|uniref:AraC-like DNA-binding protein n=1 Tax=Kribbella italica TaxID=1540520 RepID=A0A7W9J0Z8_9ACTN|nr:AraC family transcriptional regulator [Kribbella italica]MBB5833632.1 AraC-like DNA-binding protein [Kribbella italica]